MRHSVTLTAFGVFLLLGCCVRHEPDAEAEAGSARMKAALEAKTAEMEVSRGSIVRLEGEVERLLAENAKLQSQLKVLKIKDDPVESLTATQADALSCRQDLEAARDEARRYREGLERAVEEINRRARRAQAAASRETPGSGSEGSDEYVFVREPDVTSDGHSSVYVEGTIHNANDVGVGGFLELTLIADGRIAGSTTLRMDLEADTVHDYSHTFRKAVPSGAVRVTAVWGSGR